MAEAKFRLQQVPLFQEQIQKQLEHLKALRKLGEDQKSQGEKKTAKLLVRAGVIYGQSLPEFTPAKGGRAPKVGRGVPKVYCLIGKQN